MTHHVELDTLTLDRGSHSRRESGVCLLEARRQSDGTLGPLPAEVRLWSRVQRGKPADCWEWQGHRNADGYGALKVNGRTVKAHRAAWVMAGYGPIPDGMVVMHACDNPPCCNPAHLSLGTVADNNQDRHDKGRTRNLDLGPESYRSRTHCPQGHPYSGDNVRYRKDGRRRCAACYRERARASRAAKKGA